MDGCSRLGARCDHDAAGADHPRLLDRVHPAGRLGRHPGAVQHRRDVVGARRLDPALGCSRSPASPPRSPGDSANAATTNSSGWALMVMFVVTGVLRDPQLRTRRRVRKPALRFDVDFNGPGPNPLLQNHILVLFHPPILYLGYVGFTVPFALRDRCADHRSTRRRLADGDAPLGAVLVGVPHDRHPARRLVELRGARLVRCVGVGPGRERVVAAVAHRHRLHPLGARPGATRHVACLEPQPAHRPRSRSPSSARSSPVRA